jgi:hypothetical protein
VQVIRSFRDSDAERLFRGTATRRLASVAEEGDAFDVEIVDYH